MRLLSFNINAQRIEKDPKCDFTCLVAGTRNYLKAYFTFSSEWQDCEKVAVFWRGNDEYAVRLENNMCYIPNEVLMGATFKVSVIGQNEKYRITTNRILVRQEVSR